MAGSGRSAADEALAAHIAAGLTVKDAAAAAGVSERTAGRRAADAQFQARVAELRERMIGRACGTLADAMGAAATTLRGLLGSTTESIRLRAATEILANGLKVMELTQLAERVADLEQRLKGNST